MAAPSFSRAQRVGKLFVRACELRYSNYNDSNFGDILFGSSGDNVSLYCELQIPRFAVSSSLLKAFSEGDFLEMFRELFVLSEISTQLIPPPNETFTYIKQRNLVRNNRLADGSSIIETDGKRKIKLRKAKRLTP
jgi:hypothetical protein